MHVGPVSCYVHSMIVREKSGKKFQNFYDANFAPATISESFYVLRIGILGSFSYIVHQNCRLYSKTDP